MPQSPSTASSPERARTRRRIEPRFSWRPIVAYRWRWHLPRYGETISGTRYFAFGILPIWTRRDRGAR